MPIRTRKQAIQYLKSLVNKPRTELPWLKGRPKLYDCAAGYSYAVQGKVTKIVWVHELVDLMKKNKTWTKKGTPKPGDAVIYDWNGDGGCDHVAMFHSVNKAGQFVCYGADQGRPTPGKVTKLVTGKGVILGWGTPWTFTEPVKAEPIPASADSEPTTPAEEMPLKPEHYPPVTPLSGGAPSPSSGEPPLSGGAPSLPGGVVMTKEEILAYQVKKGLPQTGILDEATKARLAK